MTTKLKYKIISCSAEEEKHPVTELYVEGPSTRGWQSPKFAEYPIEIVLQFEGFTHVHQIQFLSHQHKIATKIELYMGTSESPSTIQSNPKINWKRLGYLSLDSNEKTGLKARELKSVQLNAAGHFLRVLVHKPHVNSLNLFGQVGIISVDVFGIIQSKEVADELLPSTSSFSNSKEVESPLDPVLANKIKELNKAKMDAVDVENYELAKMLKLCIIDLQQIAVDVGRLEQKKLLAVQREEYDIASSLKAEVDQKRINALRNLPDYPGKDNSDLERLISLSQRSASARRREVAHVEPSIGLESQRRSPPLPVDKGDPPPSNPQRFSRPKSPPIPTLRGQDNAANNDAFVDKSEPSIPDVNRSAQLRASQREDKNAFASEESANPENAEELPAAKKKIAEPLIPIFGEKLVLPLFSKAWADRESALKEIQQQLPQFEEDPVSVFKTCCKVIEVAFSDKITHVYYAGLSLLQTAVSTFEEIKKATSHPALAVLLPILIEKTGDSNPKTREHSMSTLHFLAQRPNVGCSFIASHLLKVKKNQAWRPILGRLELLARFISEFGYGDDDHSVPKDTVLRFIIGCFEHANVEVRNAAMNAMVESYKEDKQTTLKYMGSVKQQIRDQLETKFREASNDSVHKKSKSTTSSSNSQQRSVNGKQAVKPPLQREDTNQSMASNTSTSSIKSSSSVKSNSQKSQQQQHSVRQQIEEDSEVLNEYDNDNSSKFAARPESKSKKAAVPEEDSVSMNEAEEEDSFEVFNAEGTECQFCGAEDPLFAQEGNLDLHLMRECPMLIECTCEQVIEISCLNEHLLAECEKRTEFKQCARCREAIHRDDWSSHKAKGCKMISDDSGVSICPLCKYDFAIDDEETQWRQHLKYDCEFNPRRLIS